MGSQEEVETTVSLDTTIEQYEKDGGDDQFTKDTAKSINVDPSQIEILAKMEGSLIITFNVKKPMHFTAD